ncbi:hypothetical protein SEA_CARPAL_32 [Arthrobacter phage Carpal]|uniref:Uncharacterized protein n=5 Tax=Korravirus TaxID=1982076 RepID=A0A3S9UMA0_9CAUD|nr:hypothetical protein SEA_DINO_32 [Arthrobacter phage Dino]AZF97409.1 hypothetical protein SEA_CARPAL_32 [Arthrobacter phage Carpal]AZF98496.1 hypothetical protein SEA_BEETHOVEN_32 [Arthrobacter phage Beethoven]AZS11480.1 hypothetical protein SEA_ZORRO_32 [Arthrobacter phage Zorro]
MTATDTATKTDLTKTPTRMGTLPCGHCMVSKHDACPGGVRNGNGQIILCACKKDGCRAGQPRCTECHNTEANEIGPNWKCIDRQDCEAEQERRLAANPTIQWIRSETQKKAVVTSEDSGAVEGPPARARVARTPRKPAEPTLCTCGCEGTTKGGKFLPGHDSKYLNQLVEAAERGGRHADEAAIRADAISEAFGAKFRKRAGITK